MATTVREPLLNPQRHKRCRRKKFIAALLLVVFLLVVFGSIFAYGKSSRKFHKSLHKLEDRLEDLQKSHKNSISALQKDLESTKSHLQITPNQNRNADMRSGEVEKTLSGLQQQLKETQEEMETQREAMKELVKLFGSYKEETAQELSKLRDAQTKDQEELERLKTALGSLENQKSEESPKSFEKPIVNPRKDDSFSQETNMNVQMKNSGTVPTDVKPKANSNVLVRGAKAVKEYVSNLAAKLNPFRSSKDKNSKAKAPPVGLEGTLKRSLENVQVEHHSTGKDVDKILDKIITILGTSNLDEMEMTQSLQSKFRYLDLVLEDYMKSNVGDHDRILKWKKNYIPVKEQFEKILQETKGHHHHHHHKHTSKQFHKLAQMTRYLKDTFQSLLIK